MGGFGFDIPSFGLKKSLGVNPFTSGMDTEMEAPDIAPSSPGLPPGPSRYDSAVSGLKGLMGKQSDEMGTYQEHLAARPEDKGAGTGRKIAAGLMAAIQGWQGKPGAGMAIGRDIVERPYKRDFAKWADEAKRLEAGARIGESNLNRERQLAQFELGEAGRAESREDVETSRVANRERMDRAETTANERWATGQAQREADIARRGTEREEDLAGRKEMLELQAQARIAAEQRATERQQNDPLYRLRQTEANSVDSQRRAMEVMKDPKWAGLFEQDENGFPIPRTEMPGDGWFSSGSPLDAEQQAMQRQAIEYMNGGATAPSARSGNFSPPTGPAQSPSEAQPAMPGFWGQLFGPGGGGDEDVQPFEFGGRI